MATIFQSQHIESYKQLLVELDKAEDKFAATKDVSDLEKVKQLEIKKEEFIQLLEKEREQVLEKTGRIKIDKNTFQKPDTIKMIGDWQWAGYKDGQRCTPIRKKKGELMFEYHITRAHKVGKQEYQVD